MVLTEYPGFSDKNSNSVWNRSPLDGRDDDDDGARLRGGDEVDEEMAALTLFSLSLRVPLVCFTPMTGRPRCRPVLGSLKLVGPSLVCAVPSLTCVDRHTEQGWWGYGVVLMLLFGSSSSIFF